MAFLYRRGKNAKRRVMHLAMYDKHGAIAGSWCGRKNFDTSCNLPLGQPICKFCRKAQGTP